MSIFTNQRLTNETLRVDVENMRRGWYSDKYFENITRLLTTLSREHYTFQAESPRLPPHLSHGLAVGDIEVEAQWFNRRKPRALIGGIDNALVMLQHCSGYFDENGQFVNTWPQLEVEAVQDGVFTRYSGDSEEVQPVIKVRGIYRHFAMLETTTLGVLSRISRVATNVYNTLIESRGKPILFFPARFDLPEVQAADGYAYHLAIQRYNHDFGTTLSSFVSTDAQAAWWGGAGGGTVPHAVIACFLGNTTEAMLCFAASQPNDVPRIALVDFDNDCVGTSLSVAKAMFEHYRKYKLAGNDNEAQKFKLFGVRLDTAGNMRDVALDPLGDPKLDFGVNPRLVMVVRHALDQAWISWDLPYECRDEAQSYCRDIKIVATGGFTAEKIGLFETLGVPVDIYGVGSSLMVNDRTTNTDFTTDIVRVKLQGKWVDMAKIGRRACTNPDLMPVEN